MSVQRFGIKRGCGTCGETTDKTSMNFILSSINESAYALRKRAALQLERTTWSKFGILVTGGKRRPIDEYDGIKLFK
jgi:hypothetical protein